MKRKMLEPGWRKTYAWKQLYVTAGLLNVTGLTLVKREFQSSLPVLPRRLLLRVT
jgi:hypothetical protein